jgi:predicted permease
MFRWLEDLSQDVRYALRGLRKIPGVATVVVLSLALGIGANTAIFSLIDSVMLRLLPVERSQDLVTVLMQRPGRSASDGFTNALWEAVRDQQDVFSAVFAWSRAKQFDLAQGGTVRNVQGLMVSGDYFTALGIAPAAGRLIAAADDRRGCAPVAVLSYGFWQSHFGGAENALGSTLSLEQQPFQVIGISPPHFYGVEVGKNFDVAIPLCAAALFDKRNLDSRERWWLSIMGRVKPGMKPDAVNARLGVLSAAVMTAALPDWEPADQQRFLKNKLFSAPAANGASVLRMVFRDPLNILMTIVALVLMIACANIASLMLARATARAKEMAIRKALGASRNRLVRQLLSESALLSFLGAALGLAFARWGGALLLRNLSTGRNPIFLDLSLDGRVLAFTLAVAMVSALLVGLLPALRSTRVALIEAMKAGQVVGGEPRLRFRLGKWIVAGQVALSLVLLIAGGLLLRTFVKLLTLDPGFDRNNVLVVIAKPQWFAADTAKVPPEQRPATYDEITRRLRALPGVTSVARTYTTPIGDDNSFTEIYADNPNAPTGKEDVYFNFVAAGYFETLRTPLLAGRDFNEGDTKNAAPVAIVNQAVARKYFSGLNALGRHFRRGDVPADQPASMIEIVGIVKDSKYDSLRQVTPPTVFIPATQAPLRAQAEEFVLRTSVPPPTLISAVQQTVAQVSQQIPLEFHTLAEQVDDDLVQERLLATLAGFFSVLALVLAMIGLYGVLSYVVTQRRVEFGIRMALGAQRFSILHLVMRDVALLLAGGLAGGLAVALAIVQLLQKMLYGLTPRDPVTVVTSVCLLSAMALLAGYLPARRATRVDPMVALRYE